MAIDRTDVENQPRKDGKRQPRALTMTTDSLHSLRSLRIHKSSYHSCLILALRLQLPKARPIAGFDRTSFWWMVRGVDVPAYEDARQDQPVEDPQTKEAIPPAGRLPKCTRV